jgi:hypothetical protein
MTRQEDSVCENGTEAVSRGICGDQMMYVSLYNENLEVIGSAQFLKAASAIDNLEIWGDSYLANSGYEFRSSDKFGFFTKFRERGRGPRRRPSFEGC